MYPSYSFKKSFGKGALFVLQMAATVVLVTGVSDIQLWDLIEQHVKPIFAGVSIGGAIAIATNFVKYNWLS